MNVQTKLTVGHRGPGAPGRPAVAARLLHDRIGGGRRRLHARRRTGARARPIHTDTTGLTVGDAKVKVPGGEMPVYFAKPANVANPPVILVAMEIFGLHEYIKDVTRRLAKLGAFAIAPDYYFRKGAISPRSPRCRSSCRIVNSKPDAELFADLDATVRLGEVAGRRHQPARHHGLLPRRTHRLGICRPQSGPQGRRRVLRHAGRSARRRTRSGRRARRSSRPR